MVRSVVVALVVVLSGCSGIVASETVDPITPAPVPAEQAVYPPGVDDRRVDASILASAHAGELATTNYTLSASERVTTPMGTPLTTRSWVQKVGTVNTTYGTESREEAIPYRVGERTSQFEYWTDKAGTNRRRTDEDAVLKRHWWSTAEDEPLGDLSGSSDIRAVLSTVDLSVVRSDGGQAVLRGTTISDRERFVERYPITDLENVTVRMAVQYDGVVVAQRIVFEGKSETRSVRVVRETEITDIGSTNVSRPSWMRGRS